MTAEPAVAVVVVAFEPGEMIAACLNSVLQAGPVETVVVDNASTDDTAALVREQFPAVRLVANERNRGYGAAANQGIRSCKAPVVVLLNTDTLVEPIALTALAQYLAEHPRAAIVGPRLANPDGSLQRSTFPFPSVADTLLVETGLHLLVRRAPLIRGRSLRTWNHDAARRVPCLLGAALAIRRSAFEAVGGFDEDFFMYGEEVDLCHRLSAAGFEVHFAPVTTITHLGGASTATRPSEMHREYLVSKRRYLLRHESPRVAAGILWIMRAAVQARVLRDVVRLRRAGEHDAREDLQRSIDAQKALLRDGALWKP